MESKEHLFGIGKHLTDEGAALFVDALKLNTVDQLPSGIRDHVAGCHECKEQVTGLFVLLDDVDYSDVESHPFFKLRTERPSRVPFALKAAAVVAGVASLASLTYLIGPFSHGHDSGQASRFNTSAAPDPVQKIQYSDSLSQVPVRKEFADNFAANPDLEDLVNGETRSEAFSVLSPKNGTVLNLDAVFKWRGDRGRQLKLSILNNRGDVVLTENKSHYQYVLAQKLNPGLYYWKIESPSELLYVGKFSVK
jgi:hypothetical protein